MKALNLLLAIASLNFLFANEKGPTGPSYYVLEVTPDPELSQNVAAFDFLITSNDLHDKYGRLLFSDNDMELSVKLDGTDKFCHLTSPGKHKFQLLLNNEFFEIFTDSINAPAGHRVKVQLNFRSSTKPVLVKKPVIYLYPQATTNVSVEIKPVGDLFFTYPEYNNGWNVTANPNGELSIGQNQYNYLFWEAEQNFAQVKIDVLKGSIVKSDEVLAFMSSALEDYGLSSKEQADFITFWVPQMMQSKYSYIYFVFDEDCDAFAELNISPKPDNIGRIYMIWSPLTEGELFNTTPQEIPTVERSGFTVIEWGGAEININNRPENDL